MQLALDSYGWLIEDKILAANVVKSCSWIILTTMSSIPTNATSTWTSKVNSILSMNPNTPPLDGILPKPLPCVILLGRLDRPVRATRQLYRVCVLVFFVFLRVFVPLFINPWRSGHPRGLSPHQKVDSSSEKVDSSSRCSITNQRTLSARTNIRWDQVATLGRCLAPWGATHL